MGKWLMMILGVVFAALGLAGIISWWGIVKDLILAGAVLAAFSLGIAMIIFGASEMGGSSEKAPSAPQKSPPKDS